MASADPCQFSLTSQSGFPVFWFNGRSPQVRTLTFLARLPDLPLRLLIALGFAVCCQLALPHGLLSGLCSSNCKFASSFLQTSPHDDALAFR